MTREEALKEICVRYLEKLKRVAAKHGLLPWVEDTITAAKENRCAPTEDECEMLARCVDEERIHCLDVPKFLGISYRAAFEGGILENIKKLPRVGIYSKTDVIAKYKQMKDEKK